MGSQEGGTDWGTSVKVRNRRWNRRSDNINFHIFSYAPGRGSSSYVRYRIVILLFPEKNM